MATKLTETSEVDQIEVTKLGEVQVRQIIRILRDGQEVASTYHRYVLAPGDSLEVENERVAAIAKVVWTPEVIKLYQDYQAQLKALAVPAN